MRTSCIAGIAVTLLLAAGASAAAELNPAQRKAVEAYAARERAEMERGVVADLDGDGKTEVVAEINWFSGNSHFGRLVVFVDTGKGWRKVAQSEEPLGQIERITIKEGLIHVDSLRLGPNDARCCPSVKKTTRYRWQGAKVVEAGGQSAAP